MWVNKFPVSGVLWLVVIKSPCGVQQSIPKVSWITPAASWDVKTAVQCSPWKPA